MDLTVLTSLTETVQLEMCSVQSSNEKNPLLSIPKTRLKKFQTDLVM